MAKSKAAFVFASPGCHLAECGKFVVQIEVDGFQGTIRMDSNNTGTYVDWSLLRGREFGLYTEISIMEIPPLFG